MKRTQRRLGWWLGFGVMLVALPFALYSVRHLIWGKSLYFYSSTGLKMPLEAKIVLNQENYPLPQSNEGESLLVFDIKPAQVAAFLAQAPWKEDTWHKGPIPKRFMDNGGQILRRYWTLWDSPRLWHTAYGQAKGYSDGQLLVIAPQTGRVFFLDWNH